MKEFSKQSKMDHEISVISKMIHIFYKNKKHKDQYTAQEIEELKSYCTSKILSCPVMDKKSFCSSCKIHCYDEEHRSLIKKVMRYSGPRMIFYHPILLVKHLFLG